MTCFVCVDAIHRYTETIQEYLFIYCFAITLFQEYCILLHYHPALLLTLHLLVSFLLNPWSSFLLFPLPFLFGAEWSYCYFSGAFSGAALQGPDDWIRAFYSLWVACRAQMQIAASMKSHAAFNPRQQCCLSAGQVATCRAQCKRLLLLTVRGLLAQIY